MKKNILAAAGLSLLLNGCGGGGGALTAAGGNVTLAQASKIFTAQGVSTALASLVPSENAVSPVQMPAGFLGAFDSCTKKNPESPVDEDNDGIPLTLEVKYNCDRISGEGDSGYAKRVGSYKIVDFKDAAGAENKGWGGGYRYDFDFSNSYIASHEEFTDIYNGFFEVKKTSTTLGYNSAYTGTVDGHAKTPVAFNWNWKWQSQWENTYTPEDMAQPYAKGSAKFDGFFGVSGVMEPDNNGKQVEVKVVFALKSKGLKYDRSCARHWSEGSIIYIDGSNNEIRYEYSCTDMKVYFNGKEETMTLTRMN